LSAVEPQQHSLKRARAARRPASDPKSFSQEVADSIGPAIENPDSFSGSQRPNPPDPSPVNKSKRRKTVNQEKDNAAEFHDSGSEDVYDLYNACNGIMVDGLLDVSKLDELSPDEVEVLDVQRLKEVWAHTASGCARCAGIIRTLNVVRETLRGRVEEHSEGWPESVDVNINDPIS
jgi:hypothetical protein